MSNELKLSAAQSSRLFRLFKAEGYAMKAGITEPTLSALERRGLVTFEVIPTRHVTGIWKLTEAGLHVAKGRWA